MKALSTASIRVRFALHAEGEWFSKAGFTRCFPLWRITNLRQTTNWQRYFVADQTESEPSRLRAKFVLQATVALALLSKQMRRIRGK